MTMQQNEDIKSAVAVLQAQMTDIKAQSSRIESKLDNMLYVKPVELEDYKKQVADMVATKADKAELAPIKTLFWGIVSALILGLLGLAFNLLESHLK